MKVERRRIDPATYVGESVPSESGEWQYDNPAVHEAAITLFFNFSVSLAVVDDWIERPGRSAANVEYLTRRRGDLVRFIQAGDIAAAEGVAEFLQERLSREAERAARATDRKASREERAERARGARKLSPENERRICTRYAELVRDGKKYGARKELAGTYDVSPDTIDEILERGEANSM